MDDAARLIDRRRGPPSDAEHFQVGTVRERPEAATVGFTQKQQGRWTLFARCPPGYLVAVERR